MHNGAVARCLIRKLHGAQRGSRVARNAEVAWRAMRQLCGTKSGSCVMRKAAIESSAKQKLRGTQCSRMARNGEVAWRATRKLHGVQRGGCMARNAELMGLVLRSCPVCNKLRDAHYGNCLTHMTEVVCRALRDAWRENAEVVRLFVFCPRRNIIPTRTISQGRWVSSSLSLS